MNSASFIEFVKTAIYVGSWAIFPLIGLLIFKLRTWKRRSRNFALAGIALLTLLAYSRFIEPRILLTVSHQTILERCFPQAGSLRLAVFADMHLGGYPNSVAIGRIVRRVNKANPDLVFIAGDFTSGLAPARVASTFLPLASITAPVHAVAGNHDGGRLGPGIDKALVAAEDVMDVKMIDDLKVTATIAGQKIEIVGISDLSQGHQKTSLFDGVEPLPRLALTHNASTVGKIRRPKQNVDLMIAGHTHGGQIYVPLLTCLIVHEAACQTKRYGFKEAPRGRVFVTSGTGLTALPLRFNAAPRIDVIEVTWDACADGVKRKKPKISR